MSAATLLAGPPDLPGRYTWPVIGALVLLAALCFAAGVAVRSAGCECAHQRDQEIAAIRRLTGRPELAEPRRHRLRRSKPLTATELLHLLDWWGVLLTPERLRQIQQVAGVRQWNGGASLLPDVPDNTLQEEVRSQWLT